jgi:hypothetical protein
MKILIVKPDLDTCLAALILGATSNDEVFVVREGAPETALSDPAVICIEAGGSGRIDRNNFDHHDPVAYYPPACQQAYIHRGRKNDRMERLVEYVCMIDERQQGLPPVAFPSLSNIFSGMLLLERNPLAGFRRGLELLDKVWSDGIDPFASMPDIEEWQAYREEKLKNTNLFNEIRASAVYCQSRNGRKIGFLEWDGIGGSNALYSEGCSVAILLNNAFGEPPVRKYTIAGNGVAVAILLPVFDALEKGWGGRECIIGSPGNGSVLDKEKIIDLVIENL